MASDKIGVKAVIDILEGKKESVDDPEAEVMYKMASNYVKWGYQAEYLNKDGEEFGD